MASWNASASCTFLPRFGSPSYPPFNETSTNAGLPANAYLRTPVKLLCRQGKTNLRKSPCRKIFRKIAVFVNKTGKLKVLKYLIRPPPRFSEGLLYQSKQPCCTSSRRPVKLVTSFPFLTRRIAPALPQLPSPPAHTPAEHEYATQNRNLISTRGTHSPTSWVPRKKSKMNHKK